MTPHHHQAPDDDRGAHAEREGSRMATISERIAAGMTWLDEHIGVDWATRIDLERLDLSTCTRCIVGQLAGDQAFEGYKALGGHRRHEWPIKYGFSLPDRENRYPEGYDDLTKSWKVAIRARLAARQQEGGAS